MVNLNFLALFNNTLSGNIPAELGKLSNVDTLGLGYNRLSGPVPAELVNMANLITLGLSNNELTGVLPQSLTQLSILEEFHYDNNSGLCASDDPAFQTWIGEIPDRVGDDCSASKDGRAALTALYNATGGANWGNNTNWLSDRTLGDWYGVTTDTTGRVVALDLFENQLTGTLPVELGTLASLTILNLRDNQLGGTISC